jgi:hypothetical protein
MRLGLLVAAALGCVLGAGSTALILWPRRLAPPAETAEPPAPPPARAADPPGAPRLLPPVVPAGGAEDELTRRARTSGAPVLDPAFVARMVPVLTRGLAFLAARKRGKLLEVRCESRACQVRLRWPPESAQGRTQDPLLLAPVEPGCTRDMLPPREEQLRATSDPVEVSFFYQCPGWVEPANEMAPPAEEDQPSAAPP